MSTVGTATRLKAVLTQAGQAAGYTKDTYLGATYRLLAARRGCKRAALAVGRHILQTAYYILRDGATYHDLGASHHHEPRKETIKRAALQRLARLGYTVTVGGAPA